ncbi:MAG: TatD family hydrolase [Coriobacteriaceae bacterium]|nr:TatD family hydrolase [Coriobacteriaceae bacterium]
MKLFDMHCHLDFLEDPRGFASAAAERGLGFFSATVEPAGYLAARAGLSDAPNVYVGVGLHPWWVNDGRCGMADADAVCELLAETRFVGEIGIDLGKRCAASRDAQVAAFGRIAAACAQAGGKVLTVHAVRAGDAVLDVLERTGCLANNRVIFHWYSDTSEALWRAVRAGCYFSVNARMLATRRGREYARILPGERLLLETDLPPESDPAFSLDAWEADLKAALRELEAVRGETLETVVRENSERCLL